MTTRRCLVLWAAAIVVGALYLCALAVAVIGIVAAARGLA